MFSPSQLLGEQVHAFTTNYEVETLCLVGMTFQSLNRYTLMCWKGSAIHLFWSPEPGVALKRIPLSLIFNRAYCKYFKI